ncbi:MAG: bifunctional UDP-N-acetylglucosamine diphosphorylase/glucosamine-1-phosphate N-acetyltransferase GlmU [Paracoccaceae bacterium]|nr:bifunctional UDP-N-acetylglucosamine diphosphorylase/glucosamine-1-phosphate N-acetyltransferase GlmU [Paracoccaceae bacterium]
MDLTAVILAAGKGTRMKSNIPKVLHEIAGMPILGHVLNLTNDLGINSPTVVIGHEAQSVKSYVKIKQKDAICIIQEKQLGTGNALECAKDTLSKYDGNLLILYGDVPFIEKKTVLAMLEQLRLGADLAMLGFNTEDPTNYGRLIIEKNNNVSEIVEEKEATTVQKRIKTCNAGIYCGSSKLIFSFLKNITDRNNSDEFYLTDIVKVITNKGFKTKLVLSDHEETQGINSKKDLARAELYFQNKLRDKVFSSGVTLIDPKTIYFSHDTEIGKDSIIRPNVIFGPSVKIKSNVEILSFSHLEGCTIAKGSKIGPFARVRPETHIEENVKIGNFVEIKKTTLKTGAKANHLAYIGDAEIGSGANIGAGTIFCNYDGVFKHSTQIGKNAFIGSNSSLVAPVNIGSNALIGSGSVITNNVPDDALAISRVSQKNKNSLGKRIMEKLRSIKK